MTWQWVAIILGLAFNLTIIMVAMSEGAQYGMANGKVGGLEIDGQQIARETRRNNTETEEALSRSDTTRSL